MNISLNQFEEWLRNKNLKERTIENYIYYFNKFTYDVFNQETVSKFLSLKPNRNSIARSFLVNLQKFLMVHYQELGFSQEARVRISEVELPKLTGRVKQRLIKPIPTEDIHKIERYLESERLKLQLLLSYYCGLRLGELLKIEIISFNWDEWKKDPVKMGECRVFGKGDKEGIALIPAGLMKRIAKYIKSKKFKAVSSRLFIRESGDINLKNRARSWQMKLREAGIKAGITKLDPEGKPIKDTAVHPHRLRHSYGSYLLNEMGLDIREVQEILRHSSITSTQIYTHINKDHLKDKLSNSYSKKGGVESEQKSR